ncbi:helix-turn-helix domain-containing protein [Puteibacter caeruleilacunae]|nr:helix-turn-helix domain-containing protein [Puteibacter caeruleilacunae]
MSKREVENLPIRNLDNSLNEKVLSKFEMVWLLPEADEQAVNIEAHRHDYYHIMYIKKGRGVHSIDFKTYEIKPDSIFFVSPGQVHALNVEEPLEAYIISFNSDFYLLNNSVQKLMEFPFFHSLCNDPVIYLEESNDKIQNVLKDMFDEFQISEKGKENILRALMEVFLIRASRLYKQFVIEEAPTHLTFQLRKLEALIDTHFKEFKLLNDYADMMYISPKHLNSLCKKGLNKTVTNLIHERTLTEAKRLLLFTDNTISEIAFELGFADKSYFMRFFKKHTKLTADAYRNENKGV